MVLNEKHFSCLGILWVNGIVFWVQVAPWGFTAGEGQVGLSTDLSQHRYVHTLSLISYSPMGQHRPLMDSVFKDRKRSQVAGNRSSHASAHLLFAHVFWPSMSRSEPGLTDWSRRYWTTESSNKVLCTTGKGSWGSSRKHKCHLNQKASRSCF